MVKRLKQASILNLSFAVTAAPVLHYITQLDGNAAKGTAMSAVLIFFGGGTTAMLNWVSSTYVLTLKATPGSNSLIAETPTLLGGSRKTELEWAEIQRPTSYHPFCTFEAKGKGLFYLDEGGEMHDDTLQERIEEKLSSSDS